MNPGEGQGEDEPLNPVLRETRDAVRKLKREGGFKTLSQAGPHAPTNGKAEVEAFMAGRFPEVSEVGRKALLKKGIELQDCYRVDSVWSKVSRTSPPSDPGAYLYRMLETAALAHQEGPSAH